MTDDGSKIFHNDTNVKSFLDIEIIEVLPLECHGGVNRLLQYL